MKPDPRIFDDLSRVAGGAMNVFSAFREQAMNEIKARVEEMATRMDLVPREDFERLEMQVVQLQKKIDALSGGSARSAKKAAGNSRRAAQKTAGKKKKRS